MNARDARAILLMKGGYPSNVENEVGMHHRWDDLARQGTIQTGTM